MKIDSFTGDYRWLSNFYPCLVEFEGHIYPSTEHAYQAAKALSQKDRKPFWQKPNISAGEAKKLGRKLLVRPDWENIKLSVMETLLWEKFSKHPDLKEKLLETGDAELIESNTWGDIYFGVDVKFGGQNHLGKLLMKTRKKLNENISDKQPD